MSKILHLDIETVPAKEITADDVKVPGNMSKPETIAKYIAEEGLTKTIKDHSVDLLRCRVVCIGYSINGETPKSIVAETERDLFLLFDAMFTTEFTPPERHMVVFSGYNLKGFDYPIIALRMHKYNLAMKSYFALDINTRTRIFDLMQALANFRYGVFYSQDDVCDFLGLPKKADVDGSKVYGLWKEGKIGEIAQYCEADVQKVVDIFNIFNRS